MTQDYHVPNLNATKHEYFEWLCEMVNIDEHDCWNLAKDLHNRVFYFKNSRDEDRAMDGKELRDDFFIDNPYLNEAYRDYMDEDCSMLELLIGLAKRMDFQTSDPYEDCDRVSEFFWEMIENIGLDNYPDDVYFVNCGGYEVQEILDIFENREFKYNGVGGLFPLKNPVKDQRKQDIWNQLQSYMEENHPME